MTRCTNPNCGAYALKKRLCPVCGSAMIKVYTKLWKKDFEARRGHGVKRFLEVIRREGD